MYDVILLPTDGSDGTERAIENACYLGELTGATLHALYVVDERGGGGEWDIVVEREEARGEAALDAVDRAAESRDLPVEKHLRRGTPFEEILAATEAYDADLVVMGTNGRTGFDRFVNAGSTAERVVRYSEVPVMTARTMDGTAE